MLNLADAGSFSFVSDGASTLLQVDLSLQPIAHPFAGKLPIGIARLSVTSTQGATVPGVVAALTGTTLQLTFASAPPATDTSSAVVVYNVSYVLKY